LRCDAAAALQINHLLRSGAENTTRNRQRAVEQNMPAQANDIYRRSRKHSMTRVIPGSRFARPGDDELD
jgi:hypothetical protein